MIEKAKRRYLILKLKGSGYEVNWSTPFSSRSTCQHSSLRFILQSCAWLAWIHPYMPRANLESRIRDHKVQQRSHSLHRLNNSLWRHNPYIQRLKGNNLWKVENIPRDSGLEKRRKVIFFATAPPNKLTIFIESTVSDLHEPSYRPTLGTSRVMEWKRLD